MAISEEEGVRERLCEVARRYPQAEMARRTQCPGSSVSRYLKGNRIPVSFVVSVGREFGVNPSWLLFGEGAPWLADVSAEEGKVGTRLVELVQTMGRLSKLKLGALAGKSSAQNLRDLNDALESFERVREQLARQSRETYVRVLDDWEKAIAARDKPQCARLFKSAEQIARLCPDAALSRRHERVQGNHEYTAGNVERALVHRRRAFFSALPDNGEVDDAALNEAFSVVLSLDSLGRVGEAARFAKAALTLANNPSRFPSYWRCIGAYGWVLIQGGHMRKGMGLTATALSHLPPVGARQKCQFSMAYAMFLTGGADLRQAGEMVEPTVGHLQSLLFLSPWSRDQEPLGNLLARVAKLRTDHPLLPGWRIGRAHQLSLQGRHDAALKVWHEAESDQGARAHNAIGLDFALCAMRAQLLRAAGRESEALHAIRETEAARKAVPKTVSFDLNWSRIHWRNVLAIGSARLKQQAERFSRFCNRRGIAFGPD
jgi:tetratricopeptide (TPR) repeat protein